MAEDEVREARVRTRGSVSCSLAPRLERRRSHSRYDTLYWPDHHLGRANPNVSHRQPSIPGWLEMKLLYIGPASATDGTLYPNQRRHTCHAAHASQTRF